MAPASVPRTQTTAFGKWLADQEWNFADDNQMAWILNDDHRYLVEGIFEDSEERLVPNEEMTQALRLLQHAPQLLREVLRGLEQLGTLNMGGMTSGDADKLDRVWRLLAEVSGTCLRGQGAPLDVARAVQDQQARRE